MKVDENAQACACRRFEVAQKRCVRGEDGVEGDQKFFPGRHSVRRGGDTTSAVWHVIGERQNHHDDALELGDKVSLMTQWRASRMIGMMA